MRIPLITLPAILVIASCNAPEKTQTITQKPQQRIVRVESITSNLPTFQREDGKREVRFERACYVYDPKTRQVLNSGSSLYKEGGEPPSTLLGVTDDDHRKFFREIDGRVYFK